MQRPTQSQISRKRVLIVEDDAATRFALSRILTFKGYEVVTASNLESGLAECEDHRCVLLDLHLPDGLGLEVLKRMRERCHSARIAICSAAYDPGLRERVEHYRPDAVFIKPIDLDALLEWIARSCDADPSDSASHDADESSTTQSL